MSKEAWFRQFERLEAEHPEKDDDELGDMAHEAMVEGFAQQVDQAMDEKKEKIDGPPSR